MKSVPTKEFVTKNKVVLEFHISILELGDRKAIFTFRTFP